MMKEEDNNSIPVESNLNEPKKKKIIKKKVIHKNKASRKKSSISKLSQKLNT